MPRTDSQYRHLQNELARAETYDQWFAAAEALDDAEGLLDWREAPGSDLLHEKLIREHLYAMRHHREKGDVAALNRVLQESLYRHLGELSNPELYAVARTGTTKLATEFLDEVENAMNFICDHPMPGVSESHKLTLFQEAERVFGRPALMLSGGAAFGIYHIGVARALWEQGLLPEVIAGSSMGAIVAGGVCTRNNQELERLFYEPGYIHREAFRWLEPGQIWHRRHLMDPEQLLHHIRTNVGGMSFREAAEHSGRTLNISVSPTRTRQKPRLLNALASPEVTVSSAVLASCAVPGIYPPVMLLARDDGGSQNAEKPYMGTERWIDGSVHGDLPLLRMARLNNVNRTIVSQANPHVLPFINHHERTGARASLKQATTSVLKAQVATSLQISRNVWSRSLLQPLLDQAHSLTTQPYLGDINIQFPAQPGLYREVLANPDEQALAMYIRMGGQATWPRIPMIRDQTRISRIFANCITRLQSKIRQQ
ncbi:DUF3336 domain-containing protein [Vreelandella utahensis]|uniref:DUF3336 domain-containing protein n=1 Tax=Vreelandella halophila TaxID=86177 RepID=UPI00098545CA|nr:DUF3336 domain-containing protein [Halomonas utahensis]